MQWSFLEAAFLRFIVRNQRTKQYIPRNKKTTNTHIPKKTSAKQKTAKPNSLHHALIGIFIGNQPMEIYSFKIQT